MKVAVLTPFHQTPSAWLEQCVASVSRQTTPCTHFLVCDGDEPGGMELPAHVQILRLPQPHRDFGNAARAIGSISAICQGYEALAYLDSDNWYEPDHVLRLCEAHQRTRAAVCSSGRHLHDLDGVPLGPCFEVDGERFVDTNCLFLTRKAFGLVAAWYLMPRSQVEVGDRIVWKAILDAGLTRTHHGQPTVHYRTRHRAHYLYFGKEPPPEAKAIVLSPATARKLASSQSDQLHRSPIEIRAAYPRQRVSLCMIVKNEEGHLADCLRPVTDLVHEVILVDTGSTDRTREVAQGLGARVVEFPWVDSFAAARNEGLRHATGEWIFWLDADDRLDAENRKRLQRLFALLSEKNNVYMMRQASDPDPMNSSGLIVDHARLFRKLPGVGWRYRVHEQILMSLREARAKVVWTDIVIRHLGYRDSALRRQKMERNLRLLVLEEQERPDDAFVLFNLAGTFLDLKEVERAVPYLRRCLETAPAGASFLPKVYVMLAQSQRTINQIEEGLNYCKEGKSIYPNEVELWFEEGLLRQAGKDASGAQQCFERILELPPRPSYVGMDAGLRSYLARHHLALAYRAQARHAEAEAQWRVVFREAPHFAPAWLSWAEMCLKQGRWSDVEGMIGQLEREPKNRPLALGLRARLCLGSGDASTARQLLQEVIAQAPRALWARLWLSDLLLREENDREGAKRQLDEILALDPGQQQARNRLKRILESNPL